MDRIELGYVARAHGLRGEVRVHLHSGDPTVLLEADEVFIGGEARTIESARSTVGAVLLAIEGIEDREAAEALKGQKVEVPRSYIELEPGEYLLGDLPGCAVVDLEGRALGEVVEVIQGAQPILVIHSAAGQELMLPAVPHFVREVDTAGKRVVVDPPEDLPSEPVRK